MSKIRTLSLEEFNAEIKAQQSPGRGHSVFKCPMCGTLQTANELIAAGAAADLDEVQRYIAFSCIGRFRAGSPSAFDEMAKRLKPGKGCDFTFGGLFPICTTMVKVPGLNKSRPVFSPATPAEARAHWIQTGVIKLPLADGKASES